MSMNIGEKMVEASSEKRKLVEEDEYYCTSKKQKAQDPQLEILPQSNGKLESYIFLVPLSFNEEIKDSKLKEEDNGMEDDDKSDDNDDDNDDLDDDDEDDDSDDDDSDYVNSDVDDYWSLL